MPKSTVTFGDSQWEDRDKSFTVDNLSKSQNENTEPAKEIGTAMDVLFSADFTLLCEEIIERWHKEAEAGIPEGKIGLGMCYLFGDGVLQDKERAARLFLEAAELGDAKAQCRIGVCYDTGTGGGHKTAKKRYFGITRRQSRGIPMRFI